MPVLRDRGVLLRQRLNCGVIISEIIFIMNRAYEDFLDGEDIEKDENSRTAKISKN